eukprot:5106749-Pleurochrysis_carterae.AAC.1
MRICAHSNVERRGGVEVCGVRGRLLPLLDGCLDSAIEAERLGRLPPTQGLNEVRRTAHTLKLSGKSNAKEVPTVAYGFCRTQAVKEQGGDEVVGLRWRERVGVVSREEGNRLTNTCFDAKY